MAQAGLGRVVPGGFGVTIFFFISGFLITTLLCREQDRYGSISFRAFYLRRLLRLTPPLNWGWMRWPGIWSYSIYLVHQMMLIAFSGDRLPPLVSAVLAAGAAILWAMLLYRFVE